MARVSGCLRWVFGLLFTITILIVCTAGVFAEDLPPEQPLPPSAPSEITAAGIEETRASVAWSPVPGATHYTVWVDGQRWTGSSCTGAEIKGLQPYTEYTVYVTASNDSGESGPSPSVTFKTLPPVPGTPIPSIKAVDSAGATIEWPALPPSQYVKQYRIYVDGQFVADIDAKEGIQVAQLTNLETGDHYVTVAGVNENREGPMSQPLHFVVRAVPEPTGVTVANRGNDWVIVSWDKQVDIFKYRVFLDGELVGETREQSYLIKGLEPDTEYQIGVVAVSEDGNESLSAELTVKTSSTPPDVSLSGIIDPVYGYVPDVLPGMLVVFAIGGAIKIARTGKYALGGRQLLRWL
ncbi:fibronectin type III domain-containing protein [Syntrophothermus lipocalidus]|uniref:Fibronectin type III domain protein n=1 Tax=Syntrophothermus lipocalidus (strain DSM 12680 / TGB-C1) TaxID=643648 RepID=D7CPC9_SYNLT|nr:fibronectin type III domain-containing protein [Syntrophothermus lipocalidus]ADI02564.1 Fibronectin type III domain protein [Syntrophothermus lipocalidus DSM 12680]